MTSEQTAKSSRSPNGTRKLKIGVLIVTHYRLGEEFLQALRLILPEAPDWDAVSVDPKMPVEEVRGAIAAVNGDGTALRAGRLSGFLGYDDLTVA